MTEQVLDSDLHLNYAGSLPGSAEIPVRGWRAGDLVVDLELRRLYRDGRRAALQETRCACCACCSNAAAAQSRAANCTRHCGRVTNGTASSAT
jgi:hypothetical protein